MKRHIWTAREESLLRRNYPHFPTRKVAESLGQPLANVYAKANHMGLRKSAAFLATDASGRILKGGKLSIATQFKPGQVSHNKGLRRPGWHRGRMKESWFQKGHRPHTWKPVGTYRVNADGYLDRKVTDTGYPPRDWVAVHRLVWMKARGPIPKNHVVCFRPGRYTTERKKITVGALELVSRAELARRNRLWTKYPKELASAIHVLGQTKRWLRVRSNGEQDHHGSAGEAVRHDRPAERQGKPARNRTGKGHRLGRGNDHRKREGGSAGDAGGRGDRHGLRRQAA